MVNIKVVDQRYHPWVSDMPPGTSPPHSGRHRAPPPPTASNPSAQTLPAPPMAFNRPARGPAFTALAFALIGIAVGFVGWFRPAPHNNQPPAKPSCTEQQTADAKAEVCTSFGQVTHGIDLADAISASSSDQTAKVGAVALARQALDFGSRYLFAKVAEEPATPPDLASAVRQQANAFQELLIGYINGASSSDASQQPAQKASNEAADTIRQLCK